MKPERLFQAFVLVAALRLAKITHPLLRIQGVKGYTAYLMLKTMLLFFL